MLLFRYQIKERAMQMNGECNRCENHCAANELRCGRGYRATEDERGMDEVPVRREADYRPGMGGAFMTLPAFPGDGPVDERHRGRGHHGVDGPRDDFGGHRYPDDEDRGFDRQPGGGRGHRGHGGPGMPPHGGRPPFGRPPRPMPDGDMLRERIERAGLAELIELAGRLMHHRPGAGSARGQNLILSILAGRESLSQRELQQMLGVQPGSISEIVSKLEKKGMVTREKGEDRRGNLLRITDEGRRTLPQASAGQDDALFSALDEAQQDALAGLLRTLLSDWAARAEAEPAPGPGYPPQPDGRFITLEQRADAPQGGVKI